MELGGNLLIVDENGFVDLYWFFDYCIVWYVGVFGVIWLNENLFFCSFFFCRWVFVFEFVK